MLTVVIQAGGGSRRMGQDKALIPFLGETLIARVLRRVSSMADETIVTTNHPEGYRFLGVPLASDVIPGRGALGGLYTALKVSRHPVVAIVACDMPFVSAALLAAGRDLLLETPADAVIPQTPNGLEPFHAVYRRETCLPMVEAALQTGQWRADAWYAAAQIHYLTPEETAPLDPNDLAFLNVNTPADLETALRLAAESPAS